MSSDGGERLDALLAQPELNDIQFDERSRAFRYRDRIVPGLLRPLKRTLWPGYNYDRANDRASRRFTRKDTSLRRPSDGRTRGSRVHLQLELLTNIGTSAIKKRGGRTAIDEYTRKFLLALKCWKLRPVISELSLYDPRIGAATKADLFCLDEKNRIVLIEAKTGYYASWDRACGCMQGPLRKPLSDSPHNQSLMQLLFTKRMVEACGTRVDRAYVIRVDPDGVTPYKLPEDIERSGDALAAYVGEGMRKRRRGGTRV
jgi:hypothetical protein